MMCMRCMHGQHMRAENYLSGASIVGLAVPGGPFDRHVLVSISLCGVSRQHGSATRIRTRFRWTRVCACLNEPATYHAAAAITSFALRAEGLSGEGLTGGGKASLGC